MNEIVRFWRNLLADPGRVSAIAPSGAALAALITREISPRDMPILELGPGTGVFTSQLLRRGVPEDRLVLVESGLEFAEALRMRFPQATVLHMDARRLGTVASFEVGAVVSGLPLLSMKTTTVMRILRGSFLRMRAGGGFYQFTYGYRCPVRPAILARLGLQSTRIGWVMSNLPPASVYRITKAA
ncbi:MAG: rRNA adenine N-6-methyltransferase family protein [Paracoccus sp. (in: a-proteobacteria)]|nr:rRNA adenine N-6-methyltransferase family protein [Paracoccus sp. (in: a-proteobacteria)]